MVILMRVIEKICNRRFQQKLWCRIWNTCNLCVVHNCTVFGFIANRDVQSHATKSFVMLVSHFFIQKPETTSKEWILLSLRLSPRRSDMDTKMRKARNIVSTKTILFYPNFSCSTYAFYSLNRNSHRSHITVGIFWISTESTSHNTLTSQTEMVDDHSLLTLNLSSRSLRQDRDLC